MKHSFKNLRSENIRSARIREMANSYVAKDKVSDFLTKIGLEQYIQKFKQNEIKYEDLKELSKEDLIDMDIPVTHRKKILNAVKNKENIEETDDTYTRYDHSKHFKYEDSKYDRYDHSKYDRYDDSKYFKYDDERSDPDASQDNKYEELYEMVLNISKQQVQMIQMIEDNRRAIEEMSRSEDRSYTRNKSSSRVFQPTLSSISKQKVVHNKYMRVSPLRTSYFARHQLNEH